jgi:hypothetical protein
MSQVIIRRPLDEGNDQIGKGSPKEESVTSGRSRLCRYLPPEMLVADLFALVWQVSLQLLPKVFKLYHGLSTGFFIGVFSTCPKLRLPDSPAPYFKRIRVLAVAFIADEYVVH